VKIGNVKDDMNNYEAMYILDTQGKDESVSEIISGLEKEITTLGGAVRGVQKLDRKQFERGQHHIDSGFYINVQFSSAPNLVAQLREKLRLNASVFRQVYLRMA